MCCLRTWLSKNVNVDFSVGEIHMFGLFFRKSIGTHPFFMMIAWNPPFKKKINYYHKILDDFIRVLVVYPVTKIPTDHLKKSFIWGCMIKFFYNLWTVSLYI